MSTNLSKRLPVKWRSLSVSMKSCAVATDAARASSAKPQPEDRDDRREGNRDGNSLAADIPNASLASG